MKIKILDRAIYSSFFTLVFFLPLLVVPITSEIFEFNKIILIYLFTFLITFFWAVKCIYKGRIIYRRTILDIPILLLLMTQILSTLFSIDKTISVFGYYSRFNGGLLSFISLSLLYWAYVSNIGKKQNSTIIKALLASVTLVSVYGIFQHYGIDDAYWVQDVKNRVFSTIGQPNWLATLLIASIPLSINVFIKTNSRLWQFATILQFICFLFTKSRSGALGLGVFFGVSIVYLLIKREYVEIKKFLNIVFLFIFALIIFGSAFSKPIYEYVAPSSPPPVLNKEYIPALERGGSDSGEIRKIVWKGALGVFLNYPILGSGVETFALSYYGSRPIEHNLVSEWDYLYNKAHNEYLNFLATTGLLGLLSYLIFLSVGIFALFPKKESGNVYAFSGFLGILVANFFGFSTTTTSLMLFLLPAFFMPHDDATKENTKYEFKRLLFIPVFFLLLSFYLVARYFLGDVNYAKASSLINQKKFQESVKYTKKAVSLSPFFPEYYDQLARSMSELAVGSANANREAFDYYATQAVQATEKAVGLSPQSPILLRSQAGHYLRLAGVDGKYLESAQGSIIKSISLSPTDAKLTYNLGLIYSQVGHNDEAIELFIHTIDLKPDMRDARVALALEYKKKNQPDLAKIHLIYVLENLNPNDKFAKSELENI